MEVDVSRIIKVDELTQRRIDSQQWDYELDLTIRGVLVGDSDRVHWVVTQGDLAGSEPTAAHEDPEYIAALLERVVELLRDE